MVDMNHLIKQILIFFMTPFLISVILVPLVKQIGFKLNVYALENNRTVHKGQIVRIGGLAIYLAFMIGVLIYLKADRLMNAILFGSLVIFMSGLIDDIYNLRPLYKLLVQIIAALIVILLGNINIGLSNYLSLGIFNSFLPILNIFVSLVWIVGVTNAINLIDGLDGLSSGISILVLCTIGFLSYFLNHNSVTIICLLLVGGISGFLFYNFHPASIFVGDCGALFMGFMIATLSLVGFKTSTFINLIFPIIILFIPLCDTALAIIRRKLKGVKITEADKSHLHHVLMYKMGFSHKVTVLVLYLMTFLFGLSTIISYFNYKYGIIFMALLCLFSWIFIELTGMINPYFHPIIGLMRRTFKHPVKSDHAFFEANRIHHRKDQEKEKKDEKK